MFVAARIDDMLKVPADWKDQVGDDSLASILVAALRAKEPPMSAREAKVRVKAKLDEAWKHIHDARGLAETAELSDEDKAKLRAVMWALEQFDIR